MLLKDVFVRCFLSGMVLSAGVNMDSKIVVCRILGDF